MIKLLWVNKMSELELQRKKIEECDKKIVELFEERMEIAKKIGKIKKEQNLPIYDKEREDFLINKNINYLKNKNLSPYYKEFLENLMKISKDYQNNL